MAKDQKTYPCHMLLKKSSSKASFYCFYFSANIICPCKLLKCLSTTFSSFHLTQLDDLFLVHTVSKAFLDAAIPSSLLHSNKQNVPFPLNIYMAYIFQTDAYTLPFSAEYTIAHLCLALFCVVLLLIYFIPFDACYYTQDVPRTQGNHWNTVRKSID